jgi:threonine aldolase
VFAALAPDAADRLRESYEFYDWIKGEVRWMCAFDTAPADVDAFLAALAAAVATP